VTKDESNQTCACFAQSLQRVVKSRQILSNKREVAR
jgi:hypothetical protein